MTIRLEKRTQDRNRFKRFGFIPYLGVLPLYLSIHPAKDLIIIIKLNF